MKNLSKHIVRFYNKRPIYITLPLTIIFASIPLTIFFLINIPFDWTLIFGDLLMSIGMGFFIWGTLNDICQNYEEKGEDYCK